MTQFVFLGKAHLRFAVTALHFSLKGWPRGSRGEACAYLSVFNRSQGVGWLQPTCERHIIMLWWWVSHWCKADNSVNHNTYIRGLFDRHSVLNVGVHVTTTCMSAVFSSILIDYKDGVWMFCRPQYQMHFIRFSFWWTRRQWLNLTETSMFR